MFLFGNGGVKTKGCSWKKHGKVPKKRHGLFFVGLFKLKQARVVAGFLLALHHDSRCKKPKEPMKDLRLSTLFNQLGTTNWRIIPGLVSG